MLTYQQAGPAIDKHLEEIKSDKELSDLLKKYVTQVISARREFITADSKNKRFPNLFGNENLSLDVQKAYVALAVALKKRNLLLPDISV